LPFSNHITGGRPVIRPPLSAFARHLKNCRRPYTLAGAAGAGDPAQFLRYPHIAPAAGTFQFCSEQPWAAIGEPGDTLTLPPWSQNNVEGSSSCLVDTSPPSVAFGRRLFRLNQGIFLI
jgi:hypothetical protein